MTIGQVVERCGLRASAIRFYERSGLLPEPLRCSGQRRYGSQVLERIAVLEFAKRCGFTLAEARHLLTAFPESAPLSERLEGIAQKKITELDEKAARISVMKERIERATACVCADLRECGRKILERES